MADKRQCLACHRADVGIYEHVQKCLSRDEKTETGHGYFCKFIVPAVPDYDGPACQKGQVQYENKDTTCQTVFFYYKAVYIVFRIVRHFIFLGAFSRTLSNQSSFFDGYFCAVWLPYFVKRQIVIPAVFRGFKELFLPVLAFEHACYSGAYSGHHLSVRYPVYTEANHYRCDAAGAQYQHVLEVSAAEQYHYVHDSAYEQCT
ncbi:unknown [Bacteroides sp. CAG:1060]|nr:unknown [Bacteroides sp. CAG:1060]